MRSISGFAAYISVLITSVVSAPSAITAPPYTEQVLKNLCEARHCPPAHPTSGLLLGDDGNLYGVAGGDVFAMTPDGSGGWTYQVIATGVAAANSQAPLIRDVAGNLYGTGGDQIFKLTPNADRTSWAAQTLSTFCTQTNCPDGEGLYGGLSYAGSASDVPYDGISPNGAWTQSTLYTFCTAGKCKDGAQPVFSTLVLDNAGNLFGTTSNGGKHNGGTVFELTP